MTITSSNFQDLLRLWTMSVTEERNNWPSSKWKFVASEGKKRLSALRFLSEFFSSKIKEKRQSRSHSSRRNYLTNISALKVDNISRECGMCCTRQSRYTGPTRQLPCPMVYRPSRLTGMHVNEPRLFEGGWVTFCPFCMQNGALRVKRRRAPRVASHGSLEKQ